MLISRPRFRRYVLLCLLATTFLLAGGAIAGSADTHVTLTVDDSTPVPVETIEFEGDSYDINAITVRNQGEAFTARVTLPDKVFTDVAFRLYNSEQQIEDSEQINRPGTEETATFETDSYTPGTYMLNVELEGSTERMQPIVIAGYDVAVEHPTDPSRDEDVDITAEVTPTKVSSAPAGVEVVVWNDSHTQTFKMSQSGDETYTTSIALDQFEAGEYTVNVAALGDETFRGKQEVLALESSSLTIQETTSGDNTDDSDSDGDDGSGSDDSTSDGTSGSDDSTDDNGDDGSSSEDTSSEPDNSTSENGTSSETDDTTTDDSNESVTNGSDGSGTRDSDESDDDVIAPNEDSAGDNTDDQVSLFAMQGVFLLVIVVVSVRRLSG